MSDEEVVLKLTFDGAQASKGMRGLGDDTRKTGEAAKEAQKHLTALQEAARRLHRQDREARIRQEMEFLRPTQRPAMHPGIRPDWMNRPWWQQNIGFGGMAGVGLAAAGAGFALSSGVGAANRAMGRIGSTDPRSVNAATELQKEFVDMIPILGTLRQRLVELADNVLGLNSTIAFNAQFAAIQGRAGAVQGTRMAGQFSLAQMQQQFAVERGGLAAGLAGAERFLADVRGDPGAFVTLARTGETTGQEGELRMAAQLAQRQAEAQQVRVGDARRSVAEQEQHQAFGRHAEALRAADIARKRANDQQRAVDIMTQRPSGGSGTPMDLARMGMRWMGLTDEQQELAARKGAVGQLAGMAEGTGVEAERQREELIKRRTQLRQVEAQAQQAELRAAQSLLALEKNRLAIMDQRLGGVQQLGMNTEGENQLLTEALRMAKSQGWNALPPEFKQMLAANGLTAGFAQEQATQAGQNTPQRAEIDALLGRTGANASTAENRNAIAQAVNEASAKIAKDIEQATVTSFDTFATRVAEAFTKAIELQVQVAVQKIERDLASQQAQGRQGG